MQLDVIVNIPVSGFASCLAEGKRLHELLALYSKDRTAFSKSRPSEGRSSEKNEVAMANHPLMPAGLFGRCLRSGPCFHAGALLLFEILQPP
eukprot:scaffold282532_cov20-Prasinocladus_malaysianus.AAC.2